MASHFRKIWILLYDLPGSVHSHDRSRYLRHAIAGIDQTDSWKQSARHFDNRVFCGNGSNGVWSIDRRLFPYSPASIIFWIRVGRYPIGYWRCVGTDLCDAGNITDRQPIFPHELGVGIL